MIEKISRFCLSIVSVSHKNFSCKSPIFLYLHWEWISSLSVYFFLYLRGLKYNQIFLLSRGRDMKCPICRIKQRRIRF